MNSSSAAWTNRFRKARAPRLNRKVSIGTLISSAFLLSGSFSARAEANPPGLPPVFSSQIAVSHNLVLVAATPAPEAAPVAVTAVPPLSIETVPVASTATAAPVVSASHIVKSSEGLLQLDESGAISTQAPAPQTFSPQSAPSPSVSSQPTTPSDLVSPQSSQPQLQPVPAPKPKSGARGKNRPVSAGVAAPIVVPNSASPSSTITIAPLPDSATSRSNTPEVAPTIQVRAIISGKEQQAQIAVTPKMTVGQALAAMGVSLAVLDRVTPDASALVRDGLSIRVTRISSKLRKTNKAIPAELRYQPTTKIKAGAKSTIQQAKAGTLEITERVWMRDGKVTKREFVSQRIAAQPRHKIVALGVNSHLMPNSIRPHKRYAKALSYRGGTPRDRMLAPADPRTFAPIKSITVLSTGYSAGPAGGAIGNWTATGVRCTYGAVAVDPRLIPLGSKLYIEGYGYGFACDTGGAIKGKHIDLAFNSPSAAMRHGKRQVKVWILGP
ncbi:3D domain-containing protein [Abditibacterium utsteinense]|uniref:3D domain-containing protein n=1 Tax=Abditibacterium utsteinense TaxID=1960156 RepID=UPI0014736511|nr:3D domain-containing protein [Abditibacterium utsteinense]